MHVLRHKTHTKMFFAKKKKKKKLKLALFGLRTSLLESSFLLSCLNLLLTAYLGIATICKSVE